MNQNSSIFERKTGESHETVLIIEDDKDFNELIRRKLHRAGYNIDSAHRGAEAIDKIRSNKFELLVLDYQLPDMTANEIVDALKIMGNDVPFIMLTGQGNERVAVEMMKMGAKDYLVKDTESIDSLPHVVHRVIRELEIEIKLRWTEDQLRESEERFRQMSELSPFPVWISTSDGKTEYINPQFTTLFGYTIEDMPVCNLSPDFMCPYNSSTDGDSQILLDDSEITKKEFEITCKDGNTKIVSVRSLPMDEDKTYMVFHDITEPKRIEQMKTDFVSMVSHQLRTPVGVIRGYIDNMLSGLTGVLTDKQILYLKDMEDISAKNYNLIADLLNVSRIERGVVSVEIESVRLEDIIDRVTNEYKASIQEKGLKLLVEYEKKNMEVLADEDKMVEALCNIINNAVKFTSEGHIRIQSKCNDDYVFIDISDTGKGMPGEILQKLFSKNQILSGSPTPDGGSGLGLYIAKEFMELQHGDISTTSVEGQGSNFLFKIPLSKQDSHYGGTTW